MDAIVLLLSLGKRVSQRKQGKGPVRNGSLGQESESLALVPRGQGPRPLRSGWAPPLPRPAVSRHKGSGLWGHF
jgi:hypothetical protein